MVERERSIYKSSSGCFHLPHTHYYRQVREIFLNLLVRRLNGWDGREKVEPSTISEAPPNQETTPTPTSETPIPPPIVTDYPVKAQNATDPSSGGSSVIQPVPISAITTPHLAARSVYHSSVTGGGEMQMDYGSVSMLSPQQPSSLFMPTTAHHHQHPHAHRTHSLPTCNALQQQGAVIHMYIIMCLSAIFCDHGTCNHSV